MRKLLALIIILFLISCGSDNKSMTIFNDENGTRAPRILKVIKEKYDSNDTQVYTINYHYNNQNLLDEKNMTSDDKDIEVTHFTYNEQKQLSRISRIGTSILFSSFTNFNYSDTYYQKTALPIVISSYSEFHFNGTNTRAKIDYKYKFNKNKEAIELKSTAHRVSNHNSNKYNRPRIRYYHYKNGKLSSRVYTYFSYNKSKKLVAEKSSKRKVLYNYDKNKLLSSSEAYTKLKDSSWKLIERKTYIYEDKSYYYKQSPIEFLDQGQYGNSGIY